MSDDIVWRLEFWVTHCPRDNRLVEAPLALVQDARDEIVALRIQNDVLIGQDQHSRMLARDARADALEEAARFVVDIGSDSQRPERTHVVMKLAAAIRALKGARNDG